MRISDWSSDVCSSDLAPVSLLHLQSESKMFDVKTVFVVGAGGSKEVGLSIGDGLRDRIGDKLRIGTDRMGNISSGDDEIGRASCRESVLSVRVDLGGRRIFKKKQKRITKQIEH